MCICPLCRAQVVSTTLALRTTLYLSGETDYMPWQSALDNLGYYYLMLDRTEVYQPMQVHYLRFTVRDFITSKQSFLTICSFIQPWFVFVAPWWPLCVKAGSTHKPASLTLVILVGLHEETGDSPLLVLQKPYIRLDPSS